MYIIIYTSLQVRFFGCNRNCNRDYTNFNFKNRTTKLPRTARTIYSDTGAITVSYAIFSSPIQRVEHTEKNRPHSNQTG